jgi:uncharacterized protein YidB (DUF937 family)
MGEEIVYFHKEDEKLLKGLLKKVRAQAEKQDSGAAAAADAAEMEQLNKIVGGKLSDAEKKGALIVLIEAFVCVWWETLFFR